MSAAKRKVNPLTIQEKKAVILEVENSNGRTKSQIAEQFRIPKSTLSTILKEKERILELNDTDDLGPQRKRMRMRRGLYPQLEEALFTWLQEQAAANQVVTGPKMLARSQELARQLGVDDFKTSAGWLDGFKKRHGLNAGRPDAADGWRPEVTPEGTVPLTQLPAMLDDFAATEVFVVAEMGLMFDLTPSDTSVGGCADGALASRRFSVLAAASADGSQKLPLLVVGDYAISGASQPGRIDYHVDASSWIQSQHFSSWLSRRNGELAAQGRKALFLCELLPVHAAGGGRDSLQLACMPPSPLTQDQLSPDGVLHALKRRYRRRVAGFLKEHGRRPAAGEAVQLLSRAWWQDVACDEVRRYHASVSLLREEVNGLPPPAPAADGAAELAALAGSRFAPPDGLTLSSYAAADDALLWATPAAAAAAAVTAAGGRQSAARAPRPAPSPPQAAASPAPAPAPVKKERGAGERLGSPAGRRRPSSNEALRAVLVLQQYFELREGNEELDEVLSFVAFAKEKIVKLQMQETRHDSKFRPVPWWGREGANNGRWIVARCTPR